MAPTPTPPTLAKGATGPAVVQLQQLFPPEYQIVVDGSFGNATEAAVKSIQFVSFLAQDGVVGPQTWAALGIGTPMLKPTLKPGSTGPYVSRVQKLLTFEGTIAVEALGHPGFYFGPINGQFDAQTRAAVIAFQQHPLLTPPLVADGIVGKKTWEALTAIAQRIVHFSL